VVAVVVVLRPRRITEKDRLVYDIQPDMITIIACRFHYDDH
jgi:Txe/YoeB family toxin of Txe-Axe toxin-antitoxin module